MPEKKPTPKPRQLRGLFVTRPALQRATNEEVLEAFALIGAEVVRRNRNYGEAATTPLALLDGIQFAGTAYRIESDFAHGHYPWGVYHAQRVLTEMMAGPWVEGDGSPNFEDEFEADDDEFEADDA